jgi:hypothetical protein
VALALGSLVWCCLIAPGWKNPAFASVLATQKLVNELMSVAGFRFCAGLLDVARAATAPDIAYFKGLTEFIEVNTWGIYVLVFEKDGRVPMIYIGSSVAMKQGLRLRIQQHKARKTMPEEVERAYAAGYKLTHTAILASVPIPGSADATRMTALIYALEAALSCIFWAFRSQESSYGLSHLCPWPPTTFKYHGLCTHSSLCDALPRQNLSPEQQEEHARMRAEKDKAYQAVYQANLTANPTPEFIARRNLNNQKQAAGTKARQQAAKAEEKYMCSACGINCRDASELRRHEKSPRHMRKIGQPIDENSCEPCGKTYRNPAWLQKHLTSEGHLEKMEEKRGAEAISAWLSKGKSSSRP